MKCSICKIELGKEKHNSNPYRKGYCCTKCNNQVVIPFRLKEEKRIKWIKDNGSRTDHEENIAKKIKETWEKEELIEQLKGFKERLFNFGNVFNEKEIKIIRENMFMIIKKYRNFPIIIEYLDVEEKLSDTFIFTEKELRIINEALELAIEIYEDDLKVGKNEKK